MAIVTQKSTTVTNRDASPPVINDARLERGSLKSAFGYTAVATSDNTTSKYIFASIPSNAIVRQILLTNAALTAGVVSIGVYRNTMAGGAAVSAALFGAGVSIATAGSNTDITNSGVTYDLTKREQPLWLAAGLTSDPGGTFDIAATLTTAATAAGSLGLEVRYTDGGS